MRDILTEEHFLGQPDLAEYLIKDDTPQVHPVLLKMTGASTIRLAALRTSVKAGPSRLDAASWRKLCTSFKSAVNDLHYFPVITAQTLPSKFVDPSNFAPVLACWLIALKKNPGAPHCDWTHRKTDHYQNLIGCYKT